MIINDIFRKHTSTARQYKRLNTHSRHSYKSQNAKSAGSNRPYFAAPDKINDVVITYPNNANTTNRVRHKHRDRNNINIIEEKKQNDEDGNLSLSISNEDHMKYVKKDRNISNTITPKTKKSMAAIKDATNSSVLDNVDLTTSQTFSPQNSPRNEVNNNNKDDDDDDDEEIMHGNFANLSIDNDD